MSKDVHLNVVENINTFKNRVEPNKWESVNTLKSICSTEYYVVFKNDAGKVYLMLFLTVGIFHGPDKNMQSS